MTHQAQLEWVIRRWREVTDALKHVKTDEDYRKYRYELDALACDYREEIACLLEDHLVSNKLIESRDRVLDHPLLLCSDHGKCIPNAMEVLDRLYLKNLERQGE